MSLTRLSVTDPSAMTTAVELLKRGGIVILPTDTVYGIVCRRDDLDARQMIYEIKGREAEKQLVTLISELSDIEEAIDTTDQALTKLASAYWPGPLTIILKAHKHRPRSSAYGSVGFRWPASDLVTQIIRGVGTPLASTSANLSGRPAVVSAYELDTAFLDRAGSLAEVILLVADERVAGPGARPHGGTGKIPESTVVKLTDGRVDILREGRISSEKIRELL